MTDTDREAAMTDRSATASQARRVLQQRAEDYREPDWRTDPRTATERQAAALLADPVEDDDEDADE